MAITRASAVGAGLEDHDCRAGRPPGGVAEEFSGDLGVGGPTLAAAFIERGLVDEYHLLIHPVVLGSGTALFPPLAAPHLRQTESPLVASGVRYAGYVPA